MRRSRETAKDALIEEAAALAAARDPALADFLRVFFARGAAEDLVVYTAAELVALAEGAVEDLSGRTVGRHRITLADPDLGDAGAAHAAVTVIEILNDDMPFLVDSTMQELTAAGLDVRLLVHPILTLRRDADGRFAGFVAADAAGALRESLIHVHVARLADPAKRGEVEARLHKVLADVRAAVADWPAMQAVLAGLIAGYRKAPPPLPAEAVGEAVAFLEWLADDNFTFLGIREYDVALAEDEAGSIAFRLESGLGLLRDPEVRILRRGREFVQVTPEIREFLMRPEPLIVAKANVKSRVHRHAYMDWVGVKRYAEDGRLIGEVRLVGLFTATAYTRSTRAIPVLRRKVAEVMDRAGFLPESHSGKTLLHVLESYPRDDLFQIDVDTLNDFAIAILQLDERPRIRVLARRDKFDRFVSILVFVPRDRYSTEVRIRLGSYFGRVYQGRVSAFYPYFPEGSLTRIHFIIGRDEGATPDPAQGDLEAAVAGLVRTWTDAFEEAAVAAAAHPEAGRSLAAWAGAFPESYRASAGA